MPSPQNAVNNHEYRSVPITALAESATNPRKRFDAKSLEELAASFKTQGILAPLLVRELEESKYEVVAGARRLRAAKLAELENLPVRVVKLTDAEAIEAQLNYLQSARVFFDKTRGTTSFTCKRRGHFVFLPEQRVCEGCRQPRILRFGAYEVNRYLSREQYAICGCDSGPRTINSFCMINQVLCFLAGNPRLSCGVCGYRRHSPWCGRPEVCCWFCFHVASSVQKGAPTALLRSLEW